MRAHLAMLPLLLLSVPVKAQQAVQYSKPLPSVVCPIDLDVRHQGGLHALVPAGYGNLSDETHPHDSIVRSTPPQQSLDLNVRNVGNKRIASVDLIIQTENTGPHSSPLILGSGDTLYSKSGERFSVRLARGINAQEDSQFDRSIPTFSAISYIALEQVTYEDGSLWMAPAELACQFKLNPMVLVAEQAK